MTVMRNMTKKALKALEHFPVIAFLGPRQCGKTTFAKQLRPDWKYFDIENPDDAELISRDPMFFFKQYPQSIILDEAQEMPEIFKTLRGVIDKNRNEKGRFIITGSSSPELMDHLSETLAGRIAILQLGTLKANEILERPMSNFYQLFNEKLDKKNLVTGPAPITNEVMQHIWLKGGYPEPVLQNDEFFYQQWMQSYQDTFINRDIAKLFPRLNKTAFQRFLGVLSNLSGYTINKANLARALEVSEPTINEYLHIASGTYLWRNIPSFNTNTVKTMVKMPKGHLRDSGILNYLSKIQDRDALFRSPKMGFLFESFVIEEILKGLEASMVTNWEPYYYRTYSGAEIDLILRGPFGLLPIEIKFGSSIRQQQLMTMQKYINEFDLPFGIIVNQSDETQWVSPNIIQIPIGWL